MDILKHTNFFRAFTASSTIPSIYIQQFWDTVRYDNKTGNYICQLDEQWLDLTKDTLRDALQITPVDTNNAFSSPPTPDALIKFFWGMSTRQIDYAEMDVGKNSTNPSITFIHKFHPRPGSPLHLLNEEPVLGYLKFSAKGTKPEVFGMPILNDLITADIRGEQYYNAYLEKVAKHQRCLAGEELVTETSEAPSPAKQSKAGKVVKKRTKKSSPQLLDEFVDECIPENEPRIGDEEADLQKAVEESLKEFHSACQGPLPPVVIREPESGKFQPLPETPKKKSPADQFIFQRRTSTPTESSGHDESSSLYAELGLTGSETDSDEEVPGIVARVQDEGQAGPNAGEHDERQAGPNPGDAAASQPPSSHVENLKLPTEGEVRLKEPASSAGTLSSLQHLDKELSFADQLLVEKSQEDEPEKTNTESEFQSMVMVPIHHDTSFVPLMTTPVIDLTVSQPVPTAVQAPLPTLTTTATATTTMTTTTLPPIPPQPQQGSSDSILIKRIGELKQHMANMVEVSKAVDEIVTDAVDWAIQAPLRDLFRDLLEADMKEILHHRIWESNSYQAHEDNKMLYEALENTTWVSTSSTTSSSTTSSSSKTAALAEYTAWTTTDTRLKSSVSSIPEELHMDDDTTLDEQVQSSGDEDIGHDHIPTVNLRQKLVEATH
ncbi:E-beta-farnesene synthase [Tanacetum coccineum]